MQVLLNIDHAGFVEELNIVSSINAGSYAFGQYVANNDASGVVTKNYTGSSTTITAVATSGGLGNQRPVSRVIINLPAAPVTAGKRVAVRIVLNSATGATLLVDNVALLTSTGTPLPVELTRFDATAKGTGIALSWATASEKNSAYFEVQRSATGEAYETIGKVAAQGNSSSLREYDFTDARPLAGLAYYRLRQVDTDGTTAYSPVATARRGTEVVAIYPNPTADAVTLPASLGPVRYRILNGLGQTLASGQATGGDRLDLSKLPQGAFFLELTDNAGRHTQRLTRQ